MKIQILLIIFFAPLHLLAQSGIPSSSETPMGDDKAKGYFNYLSFGSLIGSRGDDHTHISSLLMEHNYQLNKNIAFGLVTGLEWFDAMVLPLGPNVKGLLPRRHNSCFFAGSSGGYAVALEDLDTEHEEIDAKGGPFFNAELGYIFPSKKRYNMFFALGYRYHEFISIRNDWFLNEVETKVIYNRFSFKVGVRFF